jgi:hypothetical protein
MNKPTALEFEIDELERKLARKKDELAEIRRSCQHKASIEFTPEYTVAYTLPGDPPGTMGIDWRGPTHGPSQTVRIWTWKCSECGLTQTTKRFKEERIPGAVPGTFSMQEVPVFDTLA